MKEAIFSRKEKATIAMVFSVLLFVFFWMELRPHLATKDCLKKAYAMTNNGHHQSFEENFNHCLLLKGYK